jgi:hypothetical protein
MLFNLAAAQRARFSVFRNVCIAGTFVSIALLSASSAMASGSHAGRDNLEAVSNIQIEIAPLPNGIEAVGTTRDALRTQIETALQQNHIPIASAIDDDGGILNLTVSAVVSKSPRAYVYVTRIMIGQRITLRNGQSSYAATWEDSGFGAYDDPTKVAAAIHDSVQDSLEQFVSDFRYTHSQTTPGK